ncbi:MAG: hypothetical protein GEV28_21970 [Actinophytocola sp.]|uniref:hypothetical protein n=1 Tax=Actinophytocola sp. TaxID=1872138 RepID=UPI0013232643|nr:hypothetical protein [Actinophytocola sp.]MPZ82915.1 hypothetical protein [Actinophytocola sp.]
MRAEINLGWAMAWRATLGGLVLGGGGLALCVAAVVGPPGRDPSQRALAVLFGLVLLLVGVGVLVAVRTSGLRMRLDEDGATVRHRTHGGFSVRWDELARVRLLRENRWVGRGRAWHYTLVLEPAGADFGERNPDLDLWREGADYRYELGRLGLAGRRLDRELARRCPHTYRGLTRVD